MSTENSSFYKRHKVVWADSIRSFRTNKNMTGLELAKMMHSHMPDITMSQCQNYAYGRLPKVPEVRTRVSKLLGLSLFRSDRSKNATSTLIGKSVKAYRKAQLNKNGLDAQVCFHEIVKLIVLFFLEKNITLDIMQLDGEWNLLFPHIPNSPIGLFFSVDQALLPSMTLKRVIGETARQYCVEGKSRAIELTTYNICYASLENAYLYIRSDINN